jgi:glutathione S-transferase
VIDLYTAATPNGWKASSMLEEIGDPYTVHPIQLGKLEQKQHWAGVEVEGLPHLQRWIEALRARPAVQEGIAVPAPVQAEDAQALQQTGAPMLVGATR